MKSIRIRDLSRPGLPADSFWDVADFRPAQVARQANQTEERRAPTPSAGYPAFRDLPDMLWEALVTLEICVLSMLLGVFFAVLLAVRAKGRSSASDGPTLTSALEIKRLARNTPALFQI